MHKNEKRDERIKSFTSFRKGHHLVNSNLMTLDLGLTLFLLSILNGQFRRKGTAFLNLFNLKKLLDILLTIEH